MTNYDSMSVHDLVDEALALQERATLMGGREPFTDTMQAEIEAAIRKAVIREASVGTCKIGMGFDLRLNEDSVTIADGEYYLVRKEMK